jgi:IMP dehydrogenase
VDAGRRSSQRTAPNAAQLWRLEPNSALNAGKLQNNMLNKPLEEGLTFDDVLLMPAHSEVLPGETDIRTHFSRNIQLNVPIVSAAMDTVTESDLAIAVAQHGGIGIIHKNMTIAEQSDEVDKVKRSESGMIVNPITMSPDASISDALGVMEKYRISGVPITRDGLKQISIRKYPR